MSVPKLQRTLLLPLLIFCAVVNPATGRAHAQRSSGVSRQAVSRPHTTCDAVVLSLQPGVLGLDGKRDPAYPAPPSDIVVDPVAAEAPLYAKAIRTYKHVGRGTRGPLVSERYVKTSVRKYLAPAGHAKLSTWYKRAFSACGYQRAWEHPYSQGYAEMGYQSPTTPALFISMAVQGISSTRSVVVYYAQAISPPKRTKAYRVPDPQASLTIDYSPTPSRTYRISLHDQNSLDTILGALDTSATMDVLPHTCFSPNQGQATLAFKSHKEIATVVYVLPYCHDFRLRGKPLAVSDSDLAVWYAVGMVFYRYCASHTCNPSKSGHARSQ